MTQQQLRCAAMSRLLQTIRVQAEVCADMGSAMYGDLLHLVAGDIEAGGLFAEIFAGSENDSGTKALPLRLLGGLHRLALDGRAPTLRRWYPSVGGAWNVEAARPDIMQAASEHGKYLRTALDQPPQTNEVGRSAALVGGLLVLSDRFGSPIRLFEIGSSAGLNLRADHYRYRYPGGDWGPVDSPVTIDDAWQGDLPPTAAGLNIIERHGYDIAPLDAASTDGELALLSYVWPDQQVRLDRLRGAIRVARRVPATLDRRNATDAVAGLDLLDGTLTVLWHSIMWQYLSPAEQSTIEATIEEIGARARPESPFAHLALEPHRRTPDAQVEFVVRVRWWPGGVDRLMAACSPHGPPVIWG